MLSIHAIGNNELIQLIQYMEVWLSVPNAIPQKALWSIFDVQNVTRLLRGPEVIFSDMNYIYIGLH